MQEKKPQKQKYPHLKKALYTFLVYFLISELLVIGAAFFVIRELSVDLPGLEKLEKIIDEQQLSTIIYSADGEILRTFQKEKRFWVRYDDIPQCMVDAVLAAEDQRFFKHWGFSLPDFFRALVENIKATRFRLSGNFPFFLEFNIVQGGSTITQQLAKKLYFGPEKILTRKIKEMITSIQIEKTYSKQEILEMYLNKMEFANNTFGIQAASHLYFDKNTTDLNVPESALLAGMLQNSAIYNPRSQLERRRKAALRRRNLVLWMMMRAEKIPWWRYNEEIAKPIELAITTGSDYGKAPYFVDHVRGILEEKYKEEFVYTSGAKVYTTLDYRLQQIAEKALEKQLDKIQKTYADNIPYERPEGFSNYEAFRDSLDKTAVQGALVAIDIKTGKILAMVGGREYSEQNQFNRATQARRAAGSAFKPFVYTAALDNGWRCCDTIYDGYWSIKLYDGTVWEPRNFEEEHKGVLSLRDGFKISQNMIAVKLMNDMENRGIGAPLVKKYARRMGITTYIPAVPSISIGTPEVKLIEMVSAYTVFPKFGIKTDNFAVQLIKDKNNIVIFQQKEGASEEALNPEVASLMLTMLESVIKEGTGRIMIPASGMGEYPCAGKTGTGQDFKDVWFIGFTPYIACCVWIGFDSEETTLVKPYHTGATAAIPVWAEFIKEASELLGYPKTGFKIEGNITTVPLCKDSYLRATPHCPEHRIYTEYFISGTEVQEFCDKHGLGRNNAPDPRFVPGRRSKKRVR